MSTDYDVIAIGAGHNGLVAAAYAAAAGRKVLVLERNPWFGGGVVTKELTAPGFRHDQHSMAHIFIQGNPLLRNDDLGLKSRFGLRYALPELPMMSVLTISAHPPPISPASIPSHRTAVRAAMTARPTTGQRSDCASTARSPAGASSPVKVLAPNSNINAANCKKRQMMRASAKV